ncbi:MAG: porphobilinogen synthase [Sphingobacteriales bacterium]|nr:MAG: porphobilinogen synthase [Sphingobacteriales bacterium]
MNNIRPRRLRQHAILREMVAETRLSENMFVYPYFVCKGKGIKHPVKSMPDVFHFSPDTLVKEVEKGLNSGLNKVLLFGVKEPKTETGNSCYDQTGAVPTAIRRLKAEFSHDIYLITDVCMCAYTSHGHCGILAGSQVLNDQSVSILAQMALTHAQAGADMIAPSDMMDGRIGKIRQTLDNEGFLHTSIMSYAVKYASAYYGPFRDVADSSPQNGDRKGYQMDFRNSRESIREIILDEQEGADILMVKPALAYLDIVFQIKQHTKLPVACYNVSGEYAMVKAAAASGLVDERNIVMENMYAFARAGANIIITYHAKDILTQNWV